MAQHSRHDVVEIIHHQRGRHCQVVLAGEVDSRIHSAGGTGRIVAQSYHRCEMAAGRKAE